MSKKHAAKNNDAGAAVASLGVVKTAINWGIAALSIGVVSGFVYWTVNLGTRDPHDVPIIRAMVGPSRVAPEDPGGSQASHQGLAVNSVQAAGGVEKPANSVVLAPEPAQLAEVDQPRKATSETVVAVSAEVEAEPELTQPKTEEDLDAIEIADQVAARVAEQELANIDPATIPKDVIRGTEFSPKRSLRPAERPKALATEITNIQPTSSNQNGGVKVASLDSVPIGTRLVQLGAYDSADLAKSEWAKLLAKHDHLLEDKKRLVLEAQSGGRKFYRLRAAGFNSLDESRALCSALLAVGTPCIPVTAR